mgnify:CR=1 FL=1
MRLDQFTPPRRTMTLSPRTVLRRPELEVRVRTLLRFDDYDGLR